MLEINQLYFDYAEKPVLQDVNFTLELGQLLHLKGANGAGKTTLLKLLASLLIPSQGFICYQGKLISDNLMHYREAMCYLGHKEGVHSLLTPREHWTYELASYTASRCTFEEAMACIGLQGNEDTPFALLSAGQKKRASLLRLLARDASIWLLDEPWVALDKAAILILKDLIAQHVHCKGLAITTSHQPIPFEPTDYREYTL
jgi:heme exporter protein A